MCVFFSSLLAFIHQVSRVTVLMASFLDFLFPPSISALDHAVLINQVWADQVGTLRQVTRAFELVMAADMPEVRAPDSISTASTVLSPPINSEGSPPAASAQDAIYAEMVALDTRVLALLKTAEARMVRPTRPNAGPEEEMARAFDLATRMMMAVTELVLHRRSAFPEVAFFTKRLCGLPRLNGGEWNAIAVAQGDRVAQIEAATPGNSSSTHFGSDESTSSPASHASPAQNLSFDGSQPSVLRKSTSMNGVSSSTTVISCEAYDLAPKTHPGPVAPSILPIESSSSSSSSSSLTRPLNLQEPYPSVYRSLPEQYPPYPSTQPPLAQYNSQSHQPPISHVTDSFHTFQSTSTFQPWYAEPAATHNLFWDLETDPFGPGNESALGAPTEYNQEMLDGAGGEYDWAGNAISWVADVPVVPNEGGTSLGRGGMVHRAPSGGNVVEVSHGWDGGPMSNHAPRVQQLSQPHQPPSQQPLSYEPIPDPYPQPLQQEYSQPHQRQPSASTMSTSSSSFSRSVAHQPPSQLAPSAAGPAKAWGVDSNLKPISQLITQSTSSTNPSPSTSGSIGGRRTTSASSPASFSSQQPLKSTGLDLVSTDTVNTLPFPPGLSLARCTAAAHSVVRLEILHRSATFALPPPPPVPSRSSSNTGGIVTTTAKLASPKYSLFCACGLLSAAFAFLLLAAAVQASIGFEDLNEEAEGDADGSKEEERKRLQKELNGFVFYHCLRFGGF